MIDLAALSARAEIGDVIARYCHVLDRRRWDLMGGCFHDDATYRFGSIEGGWRDFVGSARAVLDPLRASQHLIGNLLIRLDGDRADSETYFNAHHRVAAEASPSDPLPGSGVDYDVIIAGRYIDRFERRNGAWRISHRIGVTDWRRDGGAADSGLYAQPANWRGSTGPDDPGRVVLE